MSRISHSALCGLLLASALIATANAASKPHVITLGKWTTVPWYPGPDESKPQALKVRALSVDGRIKEYVIGSTHEVTERLFIVRRAFRVNDSLPTDTGAPRWQWQRGGWLLVDRTTGHISPINLPEFDASYSLVSWYRDYAAYCGVSDDGKKTYAMVVQLSRRKPVLKKMLSNRTEGVSEDATDSACPEPTWQRAPVRITFESLASAKQTFAVRGHMVDLVNENEEPEDEEASK
jgi:hypothetical protein